MKKILFAAVLLMVSAFSLTASEPQKTTVNVSVGQVDEKYAEIKFDTLTHDFGTFAEKDAIKSCEFWFTNVGTAPLIIERVISSCGCTVPKYTESPVKPGERGCIKVTYNGKGKFYDTFRKMITVRYNSKDPKEVVNLYIQGLMTRDEESKSK